MSIPSTQDMHVFYIVESCTMNLGSGNALWWVVKQINGLGDEPPVATFISRKHAEQYRDHLMATRKQVTQ